MRRSVFAIIGTVAGTALMLGAKLGTPPPDNPAAFSDSGDPAAAGDPSNAASPAASGPAGAPATPPPSAGAPSPVKSGPAPSGGATTPAAPPPTTKPPSSGLKDGKYTGSGATVAHYRYTMTVSITVSGGKISAASYTCGNASGESQSICQGRASKLVSETLSAQSANVATVSGATYSSQAYKSSLQSAIDQAKA